MTTVRFAPSPTGRIHIGNARTAILNWLYAQSHRGRFILRFDDTDLERSTTAFAEGISADLAWLGIVPDLTVAQSQRFAHYDSVAERLRQSGRLYACYETADELERQRKRRLARHQPPVYDRAGLRLSADERATLESQGRRPHWRFLLEDRPVEWNDLIRGPQHVEPGNLSDPVLIREDQSYLYTLPSVVDDIDLAITQVIRGEDHVTNTAVQIQIFEALEAPVPQFGHHSLFMGTDGKGLSKRLGSLSIEGLRDSGLEAMAVVSHAALIGTSETVSPQADMGDLVTGFDLGKLSRAPVRFDEAELAHVNARLLHQLPYEAVKARLASLGSDEGEAFWLTVRGNLERLADASVWQRVVAGPVAPVIAQEDHDFIAQAASLLPGDPWDRTTWGDWTGRLKSASGRKGKALFRPLRLALTGVDHGPELADLLPLIGREQTLVRLGGPR
ncbi:MAG: glutamate--tRNA ligase [Hyphomicrobiaceae bacterium]